MGNVGWWFRERRALEGVYTVSAVRLDRKVLNASVERRKGKIRNLSPKMVCVNLPGADPMRLRTLRIYRRYAGVDGSILRSKLHCHCNLSPWKNRTYNDHQKNLIVTQKRLHYWFIQLNFDDVGYYSSPKVWEIGKPNYIIIDIRHNIVSAVYRSQITRLS
jgi:hypothetical protein